MNYVSKQIIQNDSIIDNIFRYNLSKKFWMSTKKFLLWKILLLT